MKKTWYKTWWIWIIIVAVLAIIGSIIGGNDNAKNSGFIRSAEYL